MDVAFGAQCGRERRPGEESFLVETLAPGVQYLGVADGFGSLGSGVVGARLALGLARDHLRRKARSGAFSSRTLTTAVLQRAVVSALSYANNCLFSRSGSNDDYIAGGIAMASALVVGEQLLVGHVGDARVYIIRNGRVEALTFDDAVTIEEVPSSVSPTPAKPMTRSLLWRSLGTQARLEAGVTQVDLRPGDRFVFCTSGLHRRLTAEEIAAAILPSQSAGEALIKMRVAQQANGDEGGAVIVVFDPLRSSVHIAKWNPPTHHLSPTFIALLVTVIGMGWLFLSRPVLIVTLGIIATAVALGAALIFINAKQNKGGE